MKLTCSKPLPCIPRCHWASRRPPQRVRRRSSCPPQSRQGPRGPSWPAWRSWRPNGPTRSCGRRKCSGERTCPSWCTPISGPLSGGGFEPTAVGPSSKPERYTATVPTPSVPLSGGWSARSAGFFTLPEIDSDSSWFLFTDFLDFWHQSPDVWRFVLTSVVKDKIISSSFSGLLFVL